VLDEEDVDTEAFDLLPQCGGVRLECVLGGVVPGAEWKGDLPAHREDVDDRACALAAHVWKDELDQTGGAKQIDLELVAGVGQGYVFSAAAPKSLKPAQPTTPTNEEIVAAIDPIISFVRAGLQALPAPGLPTDRR
jgi:hypothetical protein